MNTGPNSLSWWRAVVRGVRGRLLGSYLLLLCVLLVGLSAAFSSAQVLRAHFIHTVNVVDALDATVAQSVKLLDDQETGLRGYLLTGDRTFLQPYAAAAAALPALQQRANRLLATDSRGRPLLDAMWRDAQVWHVWAAPYLHMSPARVRAAPSFDAGIVQGKAIFDRLRRSSALAIAYLATERRQSLQQSLQAMDQSGGTLFVVLCAMVSAVLLVGWLTTRSITRSLDQLARAATAIGQGDFGRPIVVSGATEFRQLSIHMDWMRHQLHSQRALTEVLGSSLRLDAVWSEFAAALRGLIPFDRLSLSAIDGDGDEGTLTMLYAEGLASGRFGTGSRRRCNETALRLLLPTQRYLLLSDLSTLPPEQQFVDLQTLLEEGLRAKAIVPLRSSGHLIGCLNFDSTHCGTYSEDLLGPVLALAPLVGAALVNAGLFTSLERANDALASANRELEAFAYSVSHDLRAPLRSMAGFSQALLEDYADKLDAEGKVYLDHVLQGSREMAQLIDALLALSRITRADMDRRALDLGALARAVIGELAQRDPARVVEVVIAEGMVVCADARLLQVALVNLLGNAWKFTRHTPAARIEVGMTAQQGMPVYVVRDNGAGFDMAYVHKLFGAFQRLHSAEEFEGTGIGLATVQRIMQRHGGRAWAEGAVGQGASIFFTLGTEGGCA